MTGLSLADPYLAGAITDSGSYTYNQPYQNYAYIKFTSAVSMRGYSFTFSGPGSSYVRVYGGATGGDYIYGPPYYAEAGALWVRVYLYSTSGDVTMSWTSVDPPPARPYRWDLATPITGSSGSITYDNVTPSIGSRWYSWAPAAGTIYSMDSDENYAYVELYVGADYATSSYVDYGRRRPDGSGQTLRFLANGGTYHINVSPYYADNPDTLFTLSWAPYYTPPYVVANDDFDHPVAIDLSAPGEVQYDNTGAWQGDSAYHYDDPRSIWFSFTAASQINIYFVATPSSSDPSKDPYMMILYRHDYSDGSYYWYRTGYNQATLYPGTEYRIMIYFPYGDFTVADTHGVLSWTVKYGAPNSSEATAIDVTGSWVAPATNVASSLVPRVWFP